MKWILLAVFTALTPIANWMIANIGTVCIPNGPCLIPVGFGLMSPSGVLVIGIALVMRDVIHELYGKSIALLAIALGAFLSFFTSTPEIAMASAATYAFAELLDFAVYTKVRAKGIGLAVLLSGVFGAFLDSALFVYLAFGSFEFSIGNTVGKLYATLAATIFLVVKKRAVFA